MFLKSFISLINMESTEIKLKQIKKNKQKSQLNFFFKFFIFYPNPCLRVGGKVQTEQKIPVKQTKKIKNPEECGRGLLKILLMLMLNHSTGMVYHHQKACREDMFCFFFYFLLLLFYCTAKIFTAAI